MKVPFTLRIDDNLLKIMRIEAVENEQSVSDAIVDNVLYSISYNNTSIHDFDDILEYSNAIDKKYQSLRKKYLVGE